MLISYEKIENDRLLLGESLVSSKGQTWQQLYIRWFRVSRNIAKKWITYYAKIRFAAH
jgi:hypothetical protein